MLSGNGTIDYDVEAQTLVAHKIYAVCQESIATRQLYGTIPSTLHGSIANNSHYVLLDHVVFVSSYQKKKEEIKRNKNKNLWQATMFACVCPRILSNCQWGNYCPLNVRQTLFGWYFYQ